MTMPPDDPPTGPGPHPERRFAEPSDTEVDAAFAALTADWHGGPGPQVVDAEVVAVREEPQPRRRATDRVEPVVDAVPRPADDPVAENLVAQDPVAQDPVAQDPVAQGRDPLAGSPAVDEPGEEDEGHFEPPEPPPVPGLARPTVGALALIVLGLVLLLAPGLVGLGGSTGFPLGLIAVSGGLTWLLSRLRSSPPPDSGWDDGARL